MRNVLRTRPDVFAHDLTSPGWMTAGQDSLNITASSALKQVKIGRTFDGGSTYDWSMARTSRFMPSSNAIAAEAFLRNHDEAEWHKLQLQADQGRLAKWQERKHTRRNLVLGAGFTLLGVLIGVGGSLLATTSTNHAFDSRTQRDFIRSQRITAFSQMNKDEANLNNQESLFLAQVRQLAGPDAGTKIFGLQTLAITLQADVENVRLVASSDTYTAALRVFSDHNAAVTTLVDYAGCLVDHKLGCKAPLIDGFGTPLDNDRDALSQSARKDLGA